MMQLNVTLVLHNEQPGSFHGAQRFVTTDIKCIIYTCVYISVTEMD